MGGVWVRVGRLGSREQDGKQFLLMLSTCSVKDKKKSSAESRD